MVDSSPRVVLPKAVLSSTFAILMDELRRELLTVAMDGGVSRAVYDDLDGARCDLHNNFRLADTSVTNGIAVQSDTS